MFLRFLLFSVLFAAPLLTLGIGNAYKPTETEINLLPPYCKVRAAPWGDNRSDPRTKRWFALFGDDFRHMHHYCDGLVKILRGDRSLRDPRAAAGHYKRALHELTYMENNASSGFRLWPELLVKKGDAHNRLSEVSNAEKYYAQAMNKYPKYIVSYKRLVDLYILQKRLTEAKTLNDLAITRFGKKKSLLKRDKKLRNLH